MTVLKAKRLCKLAKATNIETITFNPGLCRFKRIKCQT